MARAAKGREFSLERPHLRSMDELTMRKHTGNCIVDGAAEPAALRGNVDERDRPLVEAGMLVHEKSWLDRATTEAGSADNAARPLALRHA